MIYLDHWLKKCESQFIGNNDLFLLNQIDVNGANVGPGAGGLFLENSVPSSFVSFISSKSINNVASSSPSTFSVNGAIWCSSRRKTRNRKRRSPISDRFASVSMSSIKDEGDEFREGLAQNGEKTDEECNKTVSFEKVIETKKLKKKGKQDAFNTAKHLWAGAVAAMVSRTFIAPLERLKLEYIVRNEQRHLHELVNKIASSEGIKGFWKGNFVNILRTAPFKAINFYAYDTYRNQLLKLSGNEETTNFERFFAGAAAGVTATMLCIPMDTIRTVMVAPGGEALGGIIDITRHLIKTEGFLSLYKGLLPSIISMAPSGAVFYGVYDILKQTYLHSPEGKKRIKYMKQQQKSGELNAFEQLELGTVKTLLYGAIAGACAEGVTYPFEVVRRRLQMQVKANRMSSLATCVQIVEQGGVQALYAGLTPSLLQVLPSAAISYFVYEFMKIVLKVE